MGLFASLAEQYIDFALASYSKVLSSDTKTAIETTFFDCIKNHLLPSVRCLAEAVPPGEERIRKFLNHQLLEAGDEKVERATKDLIVILETIVVRILKVI